ncbi:hypothetical protein V6N13_056896 [Hibiscus sabdariffa]|uniref:Uncharacterized protein n=1 Tax=Hibiscus sabdariffa TaxID=183260 RepID=A0ABR2BID5_9ROSI
MALDDETGNRRNWGKTEKLGTLGEIGEDGISQIAKEKSLEKQQRTIKNQQRIEGLMAQPKDVALMEPLATPSPPLLEPNTKGI